MNLLQHMAGYFKKTLGPEEKAELCSVIEDFRQGLVPLVVPITLIRHHVRLHRALAGMWSIATPGTRGAAAAASGGFRFFENRSRRSYWRSVG